MATLDEWTERVCGALGVPVGDVDQRQVLDVAREVAHGVARPAAPVTAYLLGVAVGRGAEPADAARAIVDALRDWPREPEPPQ